MPNNNKHKKVVLPMITSPNVNVMLSSIIFWFLLF